MNQTQPKYVYFFFKNLTIDTTGKQKVYLAMVMLKYQIRRIDHVEYEISRRTDISNGYKLVGFENLRCLGIISQIIISQIKTNDYASIIS